MSTHLETPFDVSIINHTLHIVPTAIKAEFSDILKTCDTHYRNILDEIKDHKLENMLLELKGFDIVSDLTDKGLAENFFIIYEMEGSLIELIDNPLPICAMEISFLKEYMHYKNKDLLLYPVGIQYMEDISWG